LSWFQTIDFLTFFTDVLPAALIGFLLGIWWDKRKAAGNEKRVLKVLEKELAVNLQIIEVIRPHLKEMKIPYAHLTMAMWESVRGEIDLAKNPSLESVVAAYYNLRTFEDTLFVYSQRLTLLAIQTNKKTAAALRRIIAKQSDVMLWHIRLDETNLTKDPSVIFLVNRALESIRDKIGPGESTA